MPEPRPDPADLDRRFAGVAQLYGEAGLARLRQARVAVIGIGGVGSWAAEALARSAVGHLRLIDLDHVAESNTNRQIHALDPAYGRAKVDAMAERIAAINPVCRVERVDEFIAPDNVATLLHGLDWVVDAIDQVIAKAALVAHCRSAGLPVVVCGAGGGRRDPTRLKRDDLARVTGDPLLARVRHRLRREHGFPRAGKRTPRFDVPAVYSDEPVLAPVATGAGSPLACSGYGSSVAVTGALGFAAAALVLQGLVAGR